MSGFHVAPTSTIIFYVNTVLPREKIEFDRS